MIELHRVLPLGSKAMTCRQGTHNIAHTDYSGHFSGNQLRRCLT
ncbi:hypothetical protein FAGKG844_590017 [Frankia sp. AgKG'84/4]